ncbi:hypothetical protein SAMN05421504_113174 [Amycolatopsis xylanica]|uniref:Uncharacterized protein n=1 Tax=Amycolatopsis xylanica TaxID=589385 RepID=A0A1H3SFY7_9PSEU|nr:hypothetical protein [Amycolatopsis xylanica]SDZ36471.1 hypothetical protein SAMN05421504_113174 [Amycolatopsis xylanica]
MLELAREIVGAHYPPELDLFDVIVAEFRRDPDRLLKPDTLRAPVGIGVDLALMTPYVLAAAAYLGNVLVEKTADKALDSVSGRIAKAWAARRKAKAEGVALEVAGTGEQADLTMVITVHLTGKGATPEVAREIAGKVSDALSPGTSSDDHH